MEGGLKESEESDFGIMIVFLHSAHPSRSSLSISLRPHRQLTPTLPSPKLQQRASPPRPSPKKETLQPAACLQDGCDAVPAQHTWTTPVLLPFILCHKASSMAPPVKDLPFYFSSNIYCCYFQYYYGCSLLLCSFSCTVYLLVILNLSFWSLLLLFFMTSMTPTCVPVAVFLHD